jgi:hypothetical protein
MQQCPSHPKTVHSTSIAIRHRGHETVLLCDITSFSYRKKRPLSRYISGRCFITTQHLFSELYSNLVSNK